MLTLNLSKINLTLNATLHNPTPQKGGGVDQTQEGDRTGHTGTADILFSLPGPDPMVQIDMDFTSYLANTG